MAKAKPQPKKQDGWKDGRIKANAVKRAARHAARMSRQEQCPKRGLARALRRWCESVSRDWPRVLEGRYSMSMLVRIKRKSKGKDADMTSVSVNGKTMRSLAELAWTGRQLEQERAQRVKVSPV